MNTQLKDTLARLYREKKYPLVSRLMEELAVRDPNNLWARYCAAISELLQGNREKGLACFSDCIEKYLLCQDSSAIDAATQRFIGYVAIQAAHVSEFYMVDQRVRDLAGRLCYHAASAAASIAGRLGESGLRAAAVAILRRFIEWDNVSEFGQRREGKFLVSASPFTLQIEPTNRCNLRCSMCPRNSMIRSQGYMQDVVLDRILGTWSNRSVTLSLAHLMFEDVRYQETRGGEVKLYFMGEPLLHPRFDSFVRRLRDAGVMVVVQTNGVMLRDPDIRQRLLDSQPHLIGISIDGVSKETYEGVRQGSQWEDVCTSIQALNNERVKRGLEKRVFMSISSVIPEDSQEERCKTLQFLAPLRGCIDAGGFAVLNRQVRGDFYTASGNIAPYKAEEALSDSSVSVSDEPLFCQEALMKMNVLWDGVLIPCCYDYNGQMRLGTTDEGIDVVWQSPRTRSFHRALLSADIGQLTVCQACRGVLGKV